MKNSISYLYSAPHPLTKLILMVHILVSWYTASKPWFTDWARRAANSWLLKIFRLHPMKRKRSLRICSFCLLAIVTKKFERWRAPARSYQGCNTRLSLQDFLINTTCTALLPGGILHTVAGCQPYLWLQLGLWTKIALSLKHSAKTSPPM